MPLFNLPPSPPHQLLLPPDLRPSAMHLLKLPVSIANGPSVSDRPGFNYTLQPISGFGPDTSTPRIQHRHAVPAVPLHIHPMRR